MRKLIRKLIGATGVAGIVVVATVGGVHDAGATGAVGEAIALQSKGGPGAHVAPPSKVDSKTHAEVVHAVNAAWAALSHTQKLRLGRAFWGLYQALRDTSPAPHVAPLPADPPPTKACKTCGSFRAYPSDPCAGLRADYDRLADEAILVGLVGNVLTGLRAKLADLNYYSGIASLVGDIVTTAFTVATGGAGGSVGKAAVGALKGIAIDQIRGAVIDAIAGALPPPLDSAVSGELNEAALNALIAAINKKISEANNAKNAKMAQLQKCKASYSAALRAIDTGNAAVQRCRTSNPTYCL